MLKKSTPGRTLAGVIATGMLAMTGVVVTSAPAMAAPDFQMPFTCGTQWRMDTYDSTHAPALDIVKEPQSETEGEPVLAPADGTVTRSNYHSNAGNIIQIDHGGKHYSTFIHLQSRSVSDGDSVQQGDLIGRVGHTGPGANGTPHLHYEQGYDGNGDGNFTWGNEQAERVAVQFNGVTYGPGTGKTYRNVESQNGCRRGASYSGDAKADLMVLNTEGEITPRVNNGTYFAEREVISSGWKYFLGHEGQGRLYFADFDGDGKKDLFVHQVNGDVSPRMNTGNGFSDQGVKSSGWEYFLGHEGQGRLYFADWDGDGRDDMFVHQVNGDLSVRKNNGNGFSGADVVSSGWQSYLGHGSQGRLSFADFNGDGKDDLFVQKPDGDVEVRTNTGSYFADQGAKSSGWQAYLGHEGQGHLTFADFNGDGKDDMFVHKLDGDIDVRLNNGTYFADQGTKSSGWQAYLGHEGQGVLFLA